MQQVTVTGKELWVRALKSSHFTASHFYKTPQVVKEGLVQTFIPRLSYYTWNNEDISKQKSQQTLNKREQLSFIWYEKCKLQHRLLSPRMKCTKIHSDTLEHFTHAPIISTCGTSKATKLATNTCRWTFLPARAAVIKRHNYVSTVLLPNSLFLLAASCFHYLANTVLLWLSDLPVINFPLLININNNYGKKLIQ